MTLAQPQSPAAFGLLAFETDIAGTRAVVRVCGDLDVYTSPQLREEFRVLAERGVTQIAVDVADMTFVDSTGLGVFVGALHRLRSTGGDIALVRPRPPTRKAIEVAGLAKVLKVEG